LWVIVARDATEGARPSRMLEDELPRPPFRRRDFALGAEGVRNHLAEYALSYGAVK